MQWGKDDPYPEVVTDSGSIGPQPEELGKLCRNAQALRGRPELVGRAVRAGSGLVRRKDLYRYRDGLVRPKHFVGLVLETVTEGALPADGWLLPYEVSALEELRGSVEAARLRTTEDVELHVCPLHSRALRLDERCPDCWGDVG